MSRMSDLATMLEEFTQATAQLLDTAARLHDVSGRLTAALTKSGDEKMKAGRRKPDEPELKPAESEPQQETEKQPEPVTEPESEPATDPPPTKQEMRAMLAGLAGSGHRDEAKALVAKYANGGSFSDIDPTRYRELAEEVKQYA